jgi:GNAT superfamily N-acetyltransferase
MTTANSIVLRPVCAADEAFLFQVYISTREEELVQVTWDEQQKQSFLQMQFSAQRSHYDLYFADGSHDIIIYEGQPIGRLYVTRRLDEIRIIDITLLPIHRGIGIGTRLLKDLITEAETEKLPLRIHVERFNRALSFYERLGFQQIEDHEIYILLEWRAG